MLPRLFLFLLAASTSVVRAAPSVPSNEASGSLRAVGSPVQRDSVAPSTPRARRARVPAVPVPRWLINVQEPSAYRQKRKLKPAPARRSATPEEEVYVESQPVVLISDFGGTSESVQGWLGLATSNSGGYYTVVNSVEDALYFGRDDFSSSPTNIFTRNTSYYPALGAEDYGNYVNLNKPEYSGVASLLVRDVRVTEAGARPGLESGAPSGRSGAASAIWTVGKNGDLTALWVNEDSSTTLVYPLMAKLFGDEYELLLVVDRQNYTYLVDDNVIPVDIFLGSPARIQ